MPNVQFPCPACAQTIECDEQFAGLQLTCPLCQQVITAPPAAQAPAPASAPASKKGKLSVSAVPHSQHTPAPVPTSIQQQQKIAPPRKPINKAAIAQIAAILIALPIGLYFSWPYIQKAQAKFSKSVDSASAGSDGGQLGHIASLHETLDATEPSKHETFYARDSASTETTAPSNGTATSSVSPQVQPSGNLPSIPPNYTLTLGELEIPNSKLNGTVAGGEFKPDIVRFERVGQNYVLLLREGTNAVPERELAVFFKRGQFRFQGKTISIDKEFKIGNPQITKKWKTGPRLIGQKNFSAGYIMRLEIEKFNNGTLPGKVYIALPDPEKSVVAGHFVAETSLDFGTDTASN